MPKPRIIIRLDGVDRPLFEVCAEKGVPYGRAYGRLISGWAPEELFLPAPCEPKHRQGGTYQQQGDRWVYKSAEVTK